MQLKLQNLADKRSVVAVAKAAETPPASERGATDVMIQYCNVSRSYRGGIAMGLPVLEVGVVLSSPHRFLVAT
jgi:hypothetical protein